MRMRHGEAMGELGAAREAEQVELRRVGARGHRELFEDRLEDEIGSGSASLPAQSLEVARVLLREERSDQHDTLLFAVRGEQLSVLPGISRQAMHGDEHRCLSGARTGDVREVQLWRLGSREELEDLLCRELVSVLQPHGSGVLPPRYGPVCMLHRALSEDAVALVFAGTSAATRSPVDSRMGSIHTFRRAVTLRRFSGMLRRDNAVFGWIRSCREYTGRPVPCLVSRR